MSAILYIGGVVYLLLVIQETGKRFERDHCLWRARMQSGMYAGVIANERVTIAPSVLTRKGKRPIVNGS